MRYDIGTLLSTNTYPGRGIIIGTTPDGKKAAAAYFIMGRSVNSRNRVFEKTKDGIRTVAFDETKMEDPSLIIYHPVRTYENNLIVTNGDQTDTIYEALRRGGKFGGAVDSREFEPDAPNYTPRISGILIFENGTFSYKLNILKCVDGGGKYCGRFTYGYPAMPGVGHFLHTYKCDGNPSPSFEGEPEEIGIGNDIDAFSNLLWDNLNEDNKVSLYVRFTDLETGEYEDRIFNKNGER
ncbi:MAG: IMP cyclohydrolase [Oscillospiraceae bacterium]